MCLLGCLNIQISRYKHILMPHSFQVGIIEERECSMSNEKETQYFEPESDIELPAPLDPHISSVELRTASNNPSDYFDLALSATFGSETVRLDTGEEQLEVTISIRKAEVKFDTQNCGLHLLSDQSTEGWIGKETEMHTRSFDRSISTKGKMSGTSDLAELSVFSVGANLEAQDTSEQATSQSKKLERELLPYRIISEDIVQVGYMNDFKKPLRGKIIDEALSVRVTPKDSTSQVGVIARVRVREGWIDVRDVKPINVKKKLGDFLANIGNAAEFENEKRRKLFSKLLAHLIRINLQEQEDSINATFAASAIVFSPADNEFSGIPKPKQMQFVKIEPASINRFIQAGEEQEEEVLIELGVDLSRNEEADNEAPLSASGIFKKIWESSSNRKILPTSYGKIINLGECYSLSFGRVVNVSSQSVENAEDQLLIEITKEAHPTASVSQILDLLGRISGIELHALRLGILTKGPEMFAISNSFGFDQGYRVLCTRLSSYNSGYGRISTFHRVLDAVDASEKIVELEGLKLTFLGTEIA